MKLPIASSFFFYFIIIFFLFSCDNKIEEVKQDINTPLKKLDSVVGRMNRSEQFDSALYYGYKEYKLAQSESNEKYLKRSLSRLETAHRLNGNYDSAIVYADKLYDLSMHYKDTFYMARSRYKKGKTYFLSKSFTNAYKAYLDSKNLYLKIGDSIQVANKLLDISTVEKKTGDLVSSQLSAIEGLKYVNNPKKIIINSKLYFNIAVAAKEEGNLEVAEKRINEALDLAKDSAAIEKIGLKAVINYYNTRGNIYKEKENYTKAIEIYESLLNNSLGKLPEIEKARINSNLAHTLFLKDGFSKHADSLLKSALTIYKNKKYNSGLISVHMNLAELYSEKDIQKALFYTNEAIEYATVPYNNISIYEGLKNKALLEPNKKNITEYITIGQKIEKEEDKMQSQFANAKFDLEKEENKRIKAENEAITFENKAITAENKAANIKTQLLGLILFLIILIVLIFFIYQKIKRRHKIEKVKTVHNTEARISSKVHDELANDVYKLMTQLETSDPEREIILDKLDAIYNNARDISKQIQSIDTAAGFPEELYNLFRSYQSDEVNVLLKRYETEIWNGISSHVKTTIYRVLQELLTNMKKHSNAALVVVSIEKRNKKLFIQYIDNGKGFTEEISKNGLQNAENRIHAIEGTLTFDTELHKGCKFSINVPV